MSTMPEHTTVDEDLEPLFTPGIGTPLEHIARLEQTLPDPRVPSGNKYVALFTTLVALLLMREGTLCAEEFDAYHEDLDRCFAEEAKARWPSYQPPVWKPRMPIVGRPDLTKGWSTNRKAIFEQMYWLATPGTGVLEDVYEDLVDRFRSLYLQNPECAFAALARAIAVAEAQLRRWDPPVAGQVPDKSFFDYCIQEELRARRPELARTPTNVIPLRGRGRCVAERER
jgi:hypothetical protein